MHVIIISAPAPNAYINLWTSMIKHSTLNTEGNGQQLRVKNRQVKLVVGGGFFDKKFHRQHLLSGVIRCWSLHEPHFSNLRVGSVAFPQALQV